jgi:hypothetical protein
MRSLALLASVAALGCVGQIDPPLTGADGGGPDARADGGATPDLARQADLARSIPDLGGSDLAGLQNCFDVSVCDPTMEFCIKYFDGSQAAPGSVATGSPACYAPSDTCANQGQNMDCGCIQADPVIGVYCQGSCVDNGDGTFSCFAQ